jgi:hypothetical protein
MEANEKKARIEDAFIARMLEGPDQISVPRFTRWNGSELEPIPQDDYTVRYDGDAEHTLRRVGNADPSLINLRRRLGIEVNLDQHVLHISLDPSAA